MTEIVDRVDSISDQPGVRTVADILRADPDRPPACLFEHSPYESTLKDYDKRRYFDQEWHNREVALVWRKVWQMACREEEISEAGDFIVYDVADNSILLTRTETGAIKAFYNSCLHRGSQLQPSGSSGSVSKLTCPYHGWTYSLEGKLQVLPCRWDFPHVKDSASLTEVHVGTWGGFVFIKMNAGGPTLNEYLGVLPDHFGAWELEKRRIGAHVAKVIECNWKVGLEAFLEGYHVANVHPQGMKFTGDTNGQLDVWGPHISRMISALATPSPRLAQGAVSEQDIVEEMRGFLAGDVGAMRVEEGGSARQVMAGALKKALSAATGVDHGKFSTSEVLDAVNYLVFPNFMPWAGYGTPIVYRLRPFGNDPNRSILDVYLLFVVPDGAVSEAIHQTHWLNSGESWTTAAELGGLGQIFDQDEQNFLQIQRGLKAGGKPGVTLSSYQESRIRHLHDTLDDYLRG